MSMKDAMVKAYEKAGKKLPVSPKKRNKKRRPAKTRNHKRPVDVKADWSKGARPVARRQRVSENKRDSGSSTGVSQPAKYVSYEVDIDPDAAAAFSAKDSRSNHNLLVESAENLSGMLGVMNAAAPEEELYLGFDLGTSSLKAVVGDRNRRVHYAVPFRDAVGIDQYLLPTRLYQTGGIYSLEGESQPAYQNLKLDLMEDPTNIQARQRLAAFIALSLRQISTWFQKAHGNTYGSSNLLWSLNLGVPAAESGRLSDVMELLGWAGWIAATSEAPIDDGVIGNAMARAEQLIKGDAGPERLEDVEVGTIPEIAAQIYGYVRSDAFDPNAQNLFILADVGAGTVDCAMFKVRPDKYGEEFLFYEKSVEPLGVTPLHIHRLNWWREVFTEMEHSPGTLIGVIDTELKQIDATRPVPDKFGKYFKGISVKSSPKGPLGFYNPDAEFDQRLRAQIQDGTLEKGKQSGGWHIEALKDTPFLLSGGGSRNQFYERIKEGLRYHPSLGYLRLNPKPLVFPSDIKAPGLARQDWDRLSVAYGLSFGSVGKATFVPANDS